jgi:hypothetical protein
MPSMKHACQGVGSGRGASLEATAATGGMAALWRRYAMSHVNLCQCDGGNQGRGQNIHL